MAGCIQNENPHFGEWRENTIGVKIFKPYYVSSQKIYVKRDSVFFLAVMPTGFGLGAGELFNVFVVFVAFCDVSGRCEMLLYFGSRSISPSLASSGFPLHVLLVVQPFSYGYS